MFPYERCNGYITVQRSFRKASSIQLTHLYMAVPQKAEKCETRDSLLSLTHTVRQDNSMAYRHGLLRPTVIVERRYGSLCRDRRRGRVSCVQFHPFCIGTLASWANLSFLPISAIVTTSTHRAGRAIDTCDVDGVVACIHGGEVARRCDVEVDEVEVAAGCRRRAGDVNQATVVLPRGRPDKVLEGHVLELQR
jgi:hypothetical protein